jgi:hypothetical protein
MYRRDRKDYMKDDILYSLNRSLKIISLFKADTYEDLKGDRKMM